MKKRVVFVMLLAFIPGAGELYLGRVKKALFLLIIFTGIFLTFMFSGSYLVKVLMSGIYLVTAIPAGLESYQLARYGRHTIDTSARWYVVVLLLTTGFSALPLLWGSGRFSKRGKILWTIAVSVLAVLFFTLLARYWAASDAWLKELLT